MSYNLRVTATTSTTTSALFCLAVVQLTCVFCAVVKLDGRRELAPVTSSPALPRPSSVRPSQLHKNTVLYDILSRLCKVHNNSICSNLSSPLNETALYRNRPDHSRNADSPSQQSNSLGQQSDALSQHSDTLSHQSDTLSQQSDRKDYTIAASDRTVNIYFTKNVTKSRNVEVPHIHVHFRKPVKRGRFRYNKNVFVYGEDNRSPVYGPRMRRYPYSNVVRLSSGCTGTLLTPLHVLTAAHCVHNGEEFRNNLQMLKIEVPATMGFRIYYVEKISIPLPWLRRSSMGETARSSYDYAIIRLSFAVAGRKRFMPLTVPKANILNEDTYFLAFKSIYDPVLWSSQCHSHSNMALMDGHLLVTRCDSSVGNSGAAVFTDDPREGRRIIGIISNSRSVASMTFVTRYSIITALTWSKLYEVCSMMAPHGQRYGVCPSFHYMPVATHEPVDNRIIPFFG